MAVSPPVPLATEKQRRLCLVDAHTSCATYGAAMAARAEPPGKLSGHSRPIARMTPVILDQGRFDVRIPAWRSDRASQGVLVGLLGVAFTAILLARPADRAGAGPLVLDPSSAPGGSAVPGASVAEDPTEPPVSRTEPPATTDDPATAAPAATADPGPGSSPGSGATAQPTSSGATYRVKSGDTLIAIAGRFGTTTQVLVRLNDIADPSKLKIGQILKLP
jgi:LysM repeat protein